MQMYYTNSGLGNSYVSWKNSVTPPAFSWPPYSEENDSPLTANPFGTTGLIFYLSFLHSNETSKRCDNVILLAKRNDGWLKLHLLRLMMKPIVIKSALFPISYDSSSSKTMQNLWDWENKNGSNLKTHFIGVFIIISVMYAKKKKKKKKIALKTQIHWVYAA